MRSIGQQKGGQIWVSVRHIKVSFSSFKLTFVRISFPFRENGKGSMEKRERVWITSSK